MKKRLLALIMVFAMLIGIMSSFGIAVSAEDSLPTVTGVTMTGEGITYDAEHRLYIIPTDITEDVTVTISGTNFANLTEDCFFKYGGNVNSSVTANYGWTIDTVNNTATKSVIARYLTDGSTRSGFEFAFSPNGSSYYDMKGIGYWAVCADENPYAGAEEITIPDSLPEITNEIARAFENGSEQASYSSEDGWSGVYWSDENIYAHFTVSLAAGDVVYYELSDFVTGVGLADIEQDEWPQSYDYIPLPKKGFIEIEKDGEYVFFTDHDVKVEAYCEIHGMISHEPTSKEPYVEVNLPDGATYQWCKAEIGEVEVVNDGELGCSYGDSYYEDGVGWHGDWWGDDGGADYFCIYLEEGQTITIIPHAYCDELSIWEEEGYYGDDFYEVEAGGEVTYTAAGNRWYYVYACTDINDDTTLRAYTEGKVYTPIEGETAARLVTTAPGEYYCEVTFADGSSDTSDSFVISMFTHQPTMEEPYVEVVNPEDATYQWYKVEGDKEEVVDDGEIGYICGDSWYEEGIGWQGDWWGDDGAYYFYVYLYEGDTITINPGAYCDEIGIWDEYDEYGECFYEVEAGGEVTYTAAVEGWYYVYAYTDYADETTVRAYIGEEKITPIEGETAARLSRLSKGEYYCLVTLSDGTEEKSDSFEINNIYVTIDGVETAVDGFVELGTKNEDGTYSLPENIVGYYIDDTFVDAGKYAVTGGEVITTVEFNVTMVNGAQVRFGGGLDENGKINEGNGLRFIATVDRSDFDAEGYGMKLTAEGSSAQTIVNAEKWQDDTTFSVALIDMAESNYIRKFTATPFVRVTYDDSTEKTIYGTETVTRSIYQVAAGLLKDETQTAYGLSDVLNAYANQTGIRLVVKDGELKANTNYTTSGAYKLEDNELHFVVSDAAYDAAGNAYSVILTAQGNAEIITDNNFWYDYIRINNNNSRVKDKVTVERVEGNDKAVKVTFKADGLIERPADAGDNTTPDNNDDNFDGESEGI